MSTKKGTHYTDRVDSNCLEMIDFGLENLLSYNYNTKDAFIEYKENIRADEEPHHEPEPEAEQEEANQEADAVCVVKGGGILYMDD